MKQRRDTNGIRRAFDSRKKTAEAAEFTRDEVKRLADGTGISFFAMAEICNALSLAAHDRKATGLTKTTAEGGIKRLKTKLEYLTEGE